MWNIIIRSNIAISCTPYITKYIDFSEMQSQTSATTGVSETDSGTQSQTPATPGLSETDTMNETSCNETEKSSCPDGEDEDIDNDTG